MKSILHLSATETKSVRLGNKTQTRWPVSPQPVITGLRDAGEDASDLFSYPSLSVEQEQFTCGPLGDSNVSLDEIIAICPLGSVGETTVVTTSEGYGKAGSVLIRIIEIQIQRLEDISDAELAAEGGMSWTRFSYDWNQSHARSGYPWDINPFVWVISFELAA